MSEATFVDAAGGKVAVSLWDEANQLFDSLDIGAGVLVLGCNATVQDGEVKLNIWPGAHISTSGEQAQSLTRLNADSLTTQTLTATFSPGDSLAKCESEDAQPTCAAALADATGFPDPVTFQINRCMLDVPLQEELIVTQSGRFFIKSSRLRDRTGGVHVDIVASAVPALYGCKTEAELRDQLGAQSLTSLKTRVNARGVIRLENGFTKKYVTQVEPSPFDAIVSMTVMQISLGLSQVSNDVVLPVPAIRLLDAPLVGLAARRDNGLPIGAFRVLLLVQGSTETACDPIDDSLPLKEQTFKVTSTCVHCLLSEPATQITLVGYCDFKRIMQYRLDTETALVLASAVQTEALGSASAEGGANCVVTVEHMQKISDKHAAALSLSMALEWKSVLTPVFFESHKRSSSEQAYWTPESAKKLRRLVSEPASPVRTN